MGGSRERAVLVAFVGGSVLAGGNAVAIRFSNRELPALWGAGLRFSLAALLFLGLMAVMRLPFPHGRALAGAALYGVLNFGLAFALAYYALVEIHAGLGQTLLALVPLATLLLAVLQRQELLRPAAVIGTALALGGVALVSGASAGSSIPVLPLLAVLGAVVCLGEASVLVRRLPPMHPVTMNAVGMTVGAILLVLGSLAAGESIALPSRTATWLSLAYVVPVGSVVVFVLYVYVLQRWAASRAAFEFVLIPFVTVLLSAWLDDEPIRLGLVLGGLLVLAGVYVGALRPGGTAETGPSKRSGRT